MDFQEQTADSLSLIDTLHLREDEAKEYARVCHELIKKYNGTLTNEEEFEFDRFSSLNYYYSIRLRNSLNIERGKAKFKILFTHLQYLYKDRYGQHVGEENQAYGYIKLRQNFGRLLIRKKNLADRVFEILSRFKVDFVNHRRFTKSHVVISLKENQTFPEFSMAFKQAVSSLKLNEFIIEIKDDELIIGNKRPFTEDDLIEIIEFLFKVDKDSLHWW